MSEAKTKQAYNKYHINISYHTRKLSYPNPYIKTTFHIHNFQSYPQDMKLSFCEENATIYHIIIILYHTISY